MPQKDGFSIIELIIAGAISLTAIGVGFSLLQIALKGNKIDETQMGLNGRINDTLDFILDEVKASKRIIDNETEILQFNQNCTFPSDSQFLFGINLPNCLQGFSNRWHHLFGQVKQYPNRFSLCGKDSFFHRAWKR